MMIGLLYFFVKSRIKLLVYENCLGSRKVTVVTLSEDKQFAAKQVWSGMMRMCERPI